MNENNILCDLNIKSYMNRNYQKELEKYLLSLEEAKSIKKLLLHSCCAPCSTYCIAFLSNYFKVTVFYYNPNITEEDEYERRKLEQQKFINAYKTKYEVSFLEGRYNKEDFLSFAKEMKDEKEGGKRCISCFNLRLRETAVVAKKLDMDFFTTTLSISPLKSSIVLNAIGDRIGKEIGVKYLLSDFKKKEGYKESIKLSKEYDLYRQDYCGCIYSK